MGRTRERALKVKQARITIALLVLQPNVKGQCDTL